MCENGGDEVKWINCSERLPQQADADIGGDVVFRDIKGTEVGLFVFSYQSASNFDQWLSGACESEQAEGEGE